MTPEEIVARAIHDNAGRVPDCEALARAALSALEAAGYAVVPREPTPAMIEAGDSNETYVADYQQEPGRVWRAMLDAAGR